MKEIVRLVLDQELISFFKKGNLGKVLDLGGKNSPYKKEMLYTSYLCVDVNEENNPDIVADAHDLFMLKKDTFDTVLATELLEHCHDPHSVVREIHRILKKGGIALISTPFLYPYHPDPKDYFRYTSDGLTILFKSFSSIQIKPLGNRFFFVWEMLTWKLPFLKIFNNSIYRLANYTDKNGPTTYITIAIK
jgi:SAM-dependent methyltransferase